MSRTTELKSYLIDLNSLKEVTEALSEVSSRHVKGSRDSVLASRTYYQEVLRIYQKAREIYNAQITALNKPDLVLSSLRKNGKRVAICISSSIKFTRDINESLVKFFLEKTANQAVERIVVGHMAEEILKDLNYRGKFSLFKLRREFYEEDTNKFVEIVSAYSEIYLYYDRFATVLKQEPIQTSINYNFENQNLGTKEPKIIFEPELEKIILFFEGEILKGLIHQAFFESDLAQFSRQLVAVEDSVSNAVLLIKQNKRELVKARMSISNAKQLDRLSSFKLWKS